jgi:hypothetical protein
MEAADSACRIGYPITLSDPKNPQEMKQGGHELTFSPIGPLIRR